MTTKEDFRLMRVFAWLIRNEGVDAAAIERAVGSARMMKLGEDAVLTGPTDGEEAMRRAFVMQTTSRIAEKKEKR